LVKSFKTTTKYIGVIWEERGREEKKESNGCPFVAKIERDKA